MALAKEQTLTAKNGTKVLITSPSEDDGAELLETMKVILKASRHTLTTLEEFNFTVEKQKDRIQQHLSHPDKLIITPKVNGKIVGQTDFSPGVRNRIAHYGEFGMSIHPDYQGLGIGKMMLEALLEWARSNPRLETVRLKVHSKNYRAISLYEKCGFILEGKEVRAIKFSDGTYDDVLLMACHVQS